MFGDLCHEKIVKILENENSTCLLRWRANLDEHSLSESY